MKSLRYVVLLSLIALLLASCAGLPPVFSTQESSTGVAAGVGEAAVEPTAEPPATTEQAPAEVSETAVVTATVAAEPTAVIAATEVVTGTSPAEAASTPTAEQVMGANPLVGVVWEWAALLKTQPAVQSVVPDPAAYTVIFGEDANVLIKADCNNASGTYTLENDALTIAIGPVTRAACPPGSLSDLMLVSLSKVGSYLIDGGDLILRVTEDGDSMLFRNGGGPAVVPAEPPATEAPAGAAAPTPVGTSAAAAPAETTAPALAGTVWQWERFVDVATGQSSMDIEDPAQYTVTFMEDGTAAMKADCNQAAATYTVDGAQMSINVGPVTLAACGPNSLSETFLINLTSVATYTIENGKLNLDLMADGGRMIFGAAE